MSLPRASEANRGGFTLIEVLVYLAVLGVVGAAVVSVELVVRRTAVSETGALLALDDERRLAEQFQRDIEGALEASTADGVRRLVLKLPATKDGVAQPGKYEKVTWKRDDRNPRLLVRETDSPSKGRDASRILSHSCDGLKFEIAGRLVTVEATFGTWQGDQLLARRPAVLRALRRVDAEEKE